MLALAVSRHIDAPRGPGQGQTCFQNQVIHVAAEYRAMNLVERGGERSGLLATLLCARTLHIQLASKRPLLILQALLVLTHLVQLSEKGRATFLKCRVHVAILRLDLAQTV